MGAYYSYRAAAAVEYRILRGLSFDVYAGVSRIRELQAEQRERRLLPDLLGGATSALSSRL